MACALCESWETADLTTYRITLRPDAFWQDLPPVNGRKVVASDVVFSFRRQATPGWPNAGLLSNIESITAIDPQTVEIVLKRPDAELFELLADGHSVIVAPEAVSESGNLLEGPVVGSGPWLWKSTSETRSVFGANIAYYDPVRPGVTTLEIAYISLGTQFTALLTGIIDFAQLGPEEFETATSRNTTLRVVDVAQSGVGLEFAINTGRALFDSLETRQALLGALTPWRNLAEIWSDDAFVSVGLPVTNPDWLLPESELRTIFSEFASVPPTPLSLSRDITIKVGLFDERYQEQARSIADALSRLGATVIIEEVTTREFGDAVWFGGDYDLFLGSQPPVASLSDYLLAVYHSNGAWNTTGYSTPELDGLIEAQAVESDPAVRRQTVLEIQRQILAGAHRFAPASRVVRWVYWPFLENFRPSTRRADGNFLSAIRVGDRPPGRR
ncbi:MAG: ABC transporter substrate-binding protein [Chloroflexi bacterium]|nr:ABC transporter substrate-binding protein [Chloroflexota bacterium]